MSANASLPQAGDARRWPWRLLALTLILGAAGLRLFYLAHVCPLDLAADEAHYWDWSRNLDWSYYSKGPLVAFLIRGGTELFGPWAQQFPGGSMLAVRLPAVISGALLLLSLYVLTFQIYANEKWALLVVVLALPMPLISAGSLLMTIDSPYTCCWGWALVLTCHALKSNSLWAWIAAGLVVGVGILAKYTMVLFLPSLGLFLLTSAEQRRLLARPGFWLLCGVAALSCIPILVWNAQHDWVTFKHVNRLAGFSQQPQYSWLGPLQYVGAQASVLLGFWFVCWAAAMTAHRPWREANAGLRFLWWMSAPMFLVFLGFSIQTKGGHPNWPVTAYLSGMVLAAGWLAGQLQTGSVFTRRVLSGGVIATSLLGIVVTVVMMQSTWAYPVLTKLAGEARATEPLPLRRLDPTCRLRGWKTLAAEVDALRARLKAEGRDVVLAATSWSLPGELGFYCEGHPRVYSIGPVFGDRRSQYDLWRPNPVADPEQFAGKTFLIVSLFDMPLHRNFATVEPRREVTHYAAGEPLARFVISVAHGFRGRWPLAPNVGTSSY